MKCEREIFENEKMPQFSKNSHNRKTALIHGFLINCQSNDSLEASAIKHFYTLFMHPRLNEKVSEGSPRERARVKGQTAAASSFSNLYFSAARPPYFSPPPFAATSSSAVNAPLPRQLRPSGGSDWLSGGKILVASPCAERGG